ncbi:MAG: sigma-54-dependent Fis family transcriptional regulator [Proteobacteria bacterium]|nr:sigma-54-dependent Fis family transcriptional regulator [Pseudomonadota bacterium]
MRDKILILDDEPNLRRILEETLNRKGYEVWAFESFEAAKNTLDTEAIDVVITDLQMPGASGMDVLAYCRQYSPDLPVVMITAFGTVERAVAAMRAGAFDFVLKPFNNDELFRTLLKAAESRIRRKREPALELMSAAGVGPVPIPLFGKSAEAANFREEVERASRTGVPALLTGGVGTGKRSVAREIHRKSDRAREPFIQLNCEAVPPVFQLTELFGVEKGAGPMHLFSKPGIFELAQGGTVFIEEIDALSIEAQNALFTALENEFFTRVGGVQSHPMDARILTTSSRDLDAAMKRGEFHVELYYKLSVLPLHLRALRERKEDLASDFIPYFIERSCTQRGIPVVACSPASMSWLLSQEWPGNLGELERTIHQAVTRCDGKTLDARDLIL